MHVAARWWGSIMVAGCLCGHLLASAQDVYTWTDEKGRKHFADKVSTPENRQDKPVTVPPPNVAKRFVPVPAEGSGDANPTPPAVPPAPANKTRLPDPKKKARYSQEECEALKKAYAASEACFADCSTPTRTFRGSGRNNSNCGHCTQMTMPRC